MKTIMMHENNYAVADRATVNAKRIKCKLLPSGSA